MIAVNHSPELEQKVLENLMHFGDPNNSRVQNAFLKLTTDCFLTHDHSLLFAMIRNCFTKQQSFTFVDILVITPKDNKELFESLSWIMDNYKQFHINELSFERDVDRLVLLTRLRKQIDKAQQMVSEVKVTTDPEEAQEILIKHMNEISTLNYRESKSGLTDIEITELYYDGKIGKYVKIPTSCEQLNKSLNGGITSRSLIIIAAGASVGKTGFAIFLMTVIASMQPDTQSLFFSIEMEAFHIWSRKIGILAGKIFDELTEEERKRAIAASTNTPLTIYDAVNDRNVSDIDFIITTARLKAMKKPISVIVVDYLGLVKNKGNFERNDLRQADITNKLAELAIELNCTVIALSQINRASASRSTDDRCPWPHDAADSSGGHRSSALWLGVDRPELYLDDACYKNQFVVECRKNRFGSIFNMIYEFNDGAFGKIYENSNRKPFVPPKNKEKAIFSGYHDDFMHD